MQKTLIFLLISVISVSLFAQEWGIRAGLNTFAPIPTQIDSGAKGSFYPFLYTGVYGKWHFSNHLGAQLGIDYNRKSAGYEAPLPQAETTVLVTIFGGQQQLVNASYRGDVKGRMNLHYVEIPLNFTATFGRWEAQLGTYYSRLIAGQDTGTVHIIIGNPGVEFNRDTASFNNFSVINKNTFGLSAGLKYQFPIGIFIETRLMRSFQTLYTRTYMQSHPQNNKPLYMTGLQVGVGYRWNVHR